MKIFAQGNSSLSSFNLPMKVALSFFVLFVLLGLTSSIALYHQQFGFSSDTAAKYYRGGKAAEDAGVFYTKTSYRRLLEVTHFHLYITGLVYLAFTHLYFLSSRSTGEKVSVTVLVFLGLLIEILTPWLVRYGSGSFSIFFWFSGSAITVFTVWMALICLGEMWLQTSAD